MSIRGLAGPSKTALVISECQNGMTNPEYATNKPLVEQVTNRRIIENIAALAARLRPLGVPVFHVTIAAYPGFRAWKSNCLLAGSLTKRPLVIGDPSVDIHPLLTPEPDDYIVQRHRGLTSFHGTELEPLLNNLGIETVIMTGVSANVAINGSTIEAVNRGYSVVMPQDCVAGATAETHDFMLKNILRLLATITTSDEVAAQLEAEGVAA